MKIEAPHLEVEFQTPEAHPGGPVMIRVHVAERWAERVKGQEVAAFTDGMELHERTDTTGSATFIFHAPEAPSGELAVRLRLVPAPGIEFVEEPQEAVVTIPVN